MGLGQSGSSDSHPCVHFGQIVRDGAVALSCTHVDRGSQSVAVQLALNLRLRKLTDRAPMDNLLRGTLLISHVDYLLNRLKDELGLASRRPTFQISPHVTQRQYDSSLTDLLAVLISTERQVGHLAGAATGVLTSLGPVFNMSRTRFLPHSPHGTFIRRARRSQNPVQLLRPAQCTLVP